MKKIDIITYGCKLNQAESEYIGEKLQQLNFFVEYDKKGKNSDYVLINSCTVTKEAERKIKQLIRSIKRENKNKKVVVVGCYSHTSVDEIRKAGADLILGNLEKKYIEKYIDKNGVFVEKAYWNKNDEKLFIPTKPYNSYSRYFLPIEEGCMEFCAYCRIIFARGNKIRSVEKKEIFESIKNIYSQGIKEVVFTGINLSYFGYRTSYNLKKLIFDINNEFESKEIRFRISSLYPDFIDKEFIELLNNSSIFEKHIHLSLQHVSTTILKTMGRKYTEEYLYKLFDMIYTINPDFSISADLIVGFPGETENDFEKLITFLNKYNFSRIHAFRYSSRPNTKAARMKNQIPGNIKKNRMKELQKYISQSTNKYIKHLTGKRVKVLIEKVEGNKSFGYDEYYIYHKINGILNNNVFYNVMIENFDSTGVISRVL
ncbi:threonylcarbamoyladenosine tRNA methylthiotransferase MtaB [Marinitoga hydrogenitolerans DSM 16785]|uniref:Threonylcarbamoyladenosine tRNA methylthiotransferase MtaB n=1 Tax=Marinitoga hydrogenitolerans (strain DSM 16785 / JCM 12826 / AT1271) TaxID=1122195 RepID=A0A1M4U979_MARH1|nr:tRNA (N(6)-L-threonylcarbamoyladenosine(37)-C(2))-methylthiotransferase MtaB [Marinitoga hydrogenitolerans]SHE53275.1 threonylcarbamoyladenosine tRNA methylthiotransferase MtaB [Marinitoga hydrogenitolerans DSM 16785]